jgi:hypothetical protein
MAAIILCARCRHRFEAVGELPAECPDCHNDTTWVTVQQWDAPTHPYELWPRDIMFLHALRIDPEVPKA